MEVPDPVNVIANRADHIALHDLHVVDIEQQLHPRRIEPLYDRGAESAPITLVVLVVDLAVEQFQANIDAVLLGQRCDLTQTSDAVGDAFLVAAPTPVSEHGDEIRDAGLRCERNRLGQFIDQHIVQCQVIEPVRDKIRAMARVAHCAGQARFAHHLPILAIQQIDARKPDVLRTRT